MLPTGTKCRRLVWLWTAPWRISPWSSTVRNYSLPLSCLILHRSSLASAFTMWEEGSEWYLGQGAKCSQHSNHLGKVSYYFFQEFDFCTSWNGKQLVVWYLNCPKCYLQVNLQIFAPPSHELFKNLSAKRTSAQAQMTLCNKMDDSVEMGPPPNMFGGGLFPKSNTVYKMYNWFKSCSLLITCWQLCKFSVCSTPIHFVCRLYFDVFKRINASCGFCTSDSHFA